MLEEEEEGTPQIRRFIDKWTYKRIALNRNFKVAQAYICSRFNFAEVTLGYQLSRHSNKN